MTLTHLCLWKHLRQKQMKAIESHLESKTTDSRETDSRETQPNTEYEQPNTEYETTVHIVLGDLNEWRQHPKHLPLLMNREHTTLISVTVSLQGPGVFGFPKLSLFLSSSDLHTHFASVSHSSTLMKKLNTHIRTLPSSREVAWMPRRIFPINVQIPVSTSEHCTKQIAS